MADSPQRTRLFTRQYLEASRLVGLFDPQQLPGLLQFMRLSSGMRVLDVGTGLGYLTSVMASAVDDCVFHGVDVQPALVEAARLSLRSPTNRFVFAAADGHELPFDDQSFHRVTCLTVLMHVGSPDRVLAEMVRVCRKGGMVVAIEGIPKYVAKTQHVVGASQQVVQTILDLLEAEVAATQAPQSDYEIALKLPRYFLDVGLEAVDARAYSVIGIDRGLTPQELRREARAAVQRHAPSGAGEDDGQPKPSLRHRIGDVHRFQAGRARQILDDPAFANGVGDTQVKTMIAVRGTRA